MTPLRRFNKRLTGLPDALWATIAKIDELKGQWVAGAKLDPQLLGRLKRSVLLTSTGASTRIEGAKLSDEEIDRLMRGLAIQKFADRDSQEVRGYYELLRSVFDAWPKIAFGENTIKHFHHQLLQYVEKDQRHRGNYKNLENKVVMLDAAGNVLQVVFDTTPPYLTPKEMQELVEWTQRAIKERQLHPLLIIGNFIVEFLKIHPFQDGNGRLSRILTNLLLLKANYAYVPYVSHEKLIEDQKPEYYIALRRSQQTIKAKGETIVPWLEFFFKIVLQQATMAIALLSKENVEKLFSPKQLLVWQYLEQVQEATPAEIALHARVARPTVNQVIDKLLRLKKIERLGSGRSTRYRKI